MALVGGEVEEVEEWQEEDQGSKRCRCGRGMTLVAVQAQVVAAAAAA